MGYTKARIIKAETTEPGVLEIREDELVPTKTSIALPRRSRGNLGGLGYYLNRSEGEWKVVEDSEGDIVLIAIRK